MQRVSLAVRSPVSLQILRFSYYDINNLELIVDSDSVPHCRGQEQRGRLAGFVFGGF